jgi:hypothetical protein
MSTYDAVMAKMRERLHPVSLPMLATTLEALDARKRWTEEQRMARAAVIDEILSRSPAADAAFQAWAESDDTSIRNGSAAIVNAVRSAGRSVR